MINYYLIIFVFLAVHGIIKHGRGVGGFLGDENDFCLALNMVLPFALYSALSAESLSGRIYYIIISGLFLLANVTTLSRGGFLGLVCVVGYCVLRSKNKFAIASIMTALVLFIMLLAPSAYWDEVRSIFGETSNPQGTGAQRIYAWKLGWEIFLENPVLGVGQGNYPWHVAAIENALGMQWQERSLGGRAAHSFYFTLLPELGIVGTFLYGMLIFYIFKNIKYIKSVSKIRKGVFSQSESNRNMNQAFACEASLIGFLVSSIFISTLYYPPLYILCGFVLSYKYILQAKISESELP